MNYFITAIGTDSGKTVVSAILLEALKADYWKPIQSGSPTDRDTVKSMVSANRKFHPEQFLLKTPASPHAAAKIDGISVSVRDLKIPETSNTLIIEGAGGLLVPLNDDELMIDCIRHFNAEVILVCNIYLGSINHSLLSLEALKSRGIKIKGIIFNGEENIETQNIIMKYANVPCLLHIHKENSITPEIIRKYAEKLKAEWPGVG